MSGEWREVPSSEAVLVNPAVRLNRGTVYPFVDMAAVNLGEIPEGWEVVPLPEMIAVNPPISLRKGEVAPYLDMANMPTRRGSVFV